MPLERWLRRQELFTWALRACGLMIFAGVIALRDGPGPWDTAGRASLEVIRIHRDLSLTVRDPTGELGDAEVRLVGIRAEPAWAPRASGWIDEACSGRRVIATFDQQQRHDGAGRWLVYLYLPDGRMLNEAVIAEGLVRADDGDSYAVHQWFGKVEAHARRRKKGMWREPGPGE